MQRKKKRWKRTRNSRIERSSTDSSDRLQDRALDRPRLGFFKLPSLQELFDDTADLELDLERKDDRFPIAFSPSSSEERTTMGRFLPIGFKFNGDFFFLRVSLGLGQRTDRTWNLWGNFIGGVLRRSFQEKGKSGVVFRQRLLVNRKLWNYLSKVCWINPPLKFSYFFCFFMSFVLIGISLWPMLSKHYKKRSVINLWIGNMGSLGNLVCSNRINQLTIEIIIKNYP